MDEEQFGRVLERARGAWEDRDFDGAEYVERLRSDARLDHVYAGSPPD